MRILHTNPDASATYLNSMKILRIEGYHTGTFLLWRTADSIRHKLFRSHLDWDPAYKPQLLGALKDEKGIIRRELY
jgi:hypothetical protein